MTIGPAETFALGFFLGTVFMATIFYIALLYGERRRRQ